MTVVVDDVGVFSIRPDIHVVRPTPEGIRGGVDHDVDVFHLPRSKGTREFTDDLGAVRHRADQVAGANGVDLYELHTRRQGIGDDHPEAVSGPRLVTLMR